MLVQKKIDVDALKLMKEGFDLTSGGEKDETSSIIVSVDVVLSDGNCNF